MDTRQSYQSDRNAGSDSLTEAARAFRTWCTVKALPTLSVYGRDDNGGWYEALSHDGKPLPDMSRRVRVISRQIYAYASADKLGWYANARNIADQSWAFLRRHTLSPDGQDGYVHRLHPDLSIEDDLRDLYDHAFHLLGLAALGTKDAQIHADELLEFLDKNLAVELGYLEGIPDALPRRQNPHMHMFEALMALHQSYGGQKYLRRAGRIYRLFRERFFDAKTQSIAEYFDAELRPVESQLGRSREPGHAAEWVWLLGLYERLSGAQTREYRDALYRRLMSDAGRYIWLIDERDKSGPAIRATRRLWVQTELIKAHLTQAEDGMEGARDMAAAAIFGLLKDYLTPEGLWRDQFDADGNMVAKNVPISTFYHIICCAAEAERVAAKAITRRPIRSARPA